MKINYLVIITLILFFSSCVAKQKFTSLETEYKKMQKENSRLDAELSIKQNDNKELNYEIKKLSKEIDKLKDSLKIINIKYEDTTRTADYYFQKSNNYLNTKDYKNAYKNLNLILNQYPSSSLVNQSKEKLNLLEKISNENLKNIHNRISHLDLKEKISIIKTAKRDEFFTYSDSIALNNSFETYLTKFEAEKYISTKEDKMQSCIFIETTRNTLQYTRYGGGLKFEVYVVKPNNKKKYLRLRTEYKSSDWLFYEKVIIRGSNDVQIEIVTKYPEKETESDGSGVTEWSDNYISDQLEKKLLKISEAEKIFVRYVGKYSSEMTLNDEQVLAFKEIIQQFRKK